MARCRSCGGKHHILVHREHDTPAVVKVVAAGNAPVLTEVVPPVVNVVAINANASSSSVPHTFPSSLMMTVQVLVKGLGGRQSMARALLDSGASMSLVSNRVAQTLHLSNVSTNVSFSGAQATPLQGAQAITSMSLCPMNSEEPVLAVTAAIVSKVTCDLPLQGATHVRDMPHIKSLKLADHTFHLPGRVDLLLGCDIIPEIMLHVHVSGPKDTLMAMNTIFGWAVLGKYSPKGSNQSINTISPAGADPLEPLLTHFWEVEETSSESPALTPDEEAVQKHFEATHLYIDPPDHYQVSLPRRDAHTSLGLSRPQAVNRFLSNERSVQCKGT